MASTPVPEHLDSLDGWRGLAIATLVVGHFLPVPGIDLGTLGVNLFFVLSGWLMTRLLFVQHTPIDTFYRRRISRIIPVHVTFIALATGFWLATDHPFSLTETLSALGFVNNYVGLDGSHLVMPFGHIWSLSVEEHSYILLSLLAVCARKRQLKDIFTVGAVAFTCALFALGYTILYPGPHLQFGPWLHTEVAGYGIFVSGFVLLCLRRIDRPRWPAFSVPLLLGLALCLHWWSVPLAIQKIVGVGALALAVNALPAAPQWVQGALSLAPLRLLGLCSFSLYVWQQPFYLWARNGAMPIWAGLLGALACGLASYYLIERPARSYLNRHWGGRASAELAPAAQT